MKFKLDENVDLRILSEFRLAGYNVATVPEQKMTAAPDTELIEVCHQEDRCLVTADRDFSNRGRYNPANYSGIVVVRLPPQVQLADWREAITTLILGLESADVVGKLWVIQGDRIQEYRPIVERSAEDE
jgi:predicted nuclease of predicted toxin-antitoxin system